MAKVEKTVNLDTLLNFDAHYCMFEDNEKMKRWKLNFLVVARSKKKINDSDLTLAYSKGSKMKLPVIFISPGGLTKKAEKYLEENKGYVVFRSMNS